MTVTSIKKQERLRKRMVDGDILEQFVEAPPIAAWFDMMEKQAMHVLVNAPLEAQDVRTVAACEVQTLRRLRMVLKNGVSAGKKAGEEYSDAVFEEQG